MGERELALSVTKVALCAGDGRSTTPDGVGVTAERLEHFSAQPARSAQSPFVCLSQCSMSGQQSDCAAADEPCGEWTNALAPATRRQGQRQGDQGYENGSDDAHGSARLIRPVSLPPSSDRAVRLTRLAGLS